MASPRTLPFSRVRVLECIEVGLYRCVDDRRSVSCRRFAPPPLLRQPPKPPPTPIITPSQVVVPANTEPVLEADLEPDQDLDAAAHGDGVDPEQPTRRHGVTEEKGQHLAHDTAPLGDGPDQQNGPAPSAEHGSEAWLADAQAAAPIAAIARAVEKSTALKTLAELVIRTCEGDDKRETGPWVLTLPLEAQGLGRSRLNLRLSRELLELRFECESRDLRDLLFGQSKSLQARLEERLQIPLDIEVALGDH